MQRAATRRSEPSAAGEATIWQTACSPGSAPPQKTSDFPAAILFSGFLWLVQWCEVRALPELQFCARTHQC